MKGMRAYALMLVATTMLLAVVWWIRRPAPRPPSTTEIAARAAKPRHTLLPLPPELDGVEVGMDLAFLRKARPRAVVNQAAEDETYYVYDEKVSRTERAVYMISKRDLVVEKIQLASQLPGVESIQPRVAAHANRYRSAAHVWDCPNRGNSYLATRRFTWQVGDMGVMDVYLVVGDAVSATLFVAPFDTIRASLGNAGCVPTPAERLTLFPVPIRPKTP